MQRLFSKMLSGWMAFGRFLELVVTSLIFGLLYLVLIGAVSLGRRLLGRRTASPAGWIPRPPAEPTLASLERQF